MIHTASCVAHPPPLSTLGMDWVPTPEILDEVPLSAGLPAKSYPIPLLWSKNSNCTWEIRSGYSITIFFTQVKDEVIIITTWRHDIVLLIVVNLLPLLSIIGRAPGIVESIVAPCLGVWWDGTAQSYSAPSNRQRGLVPLDVAQERGTRWILDPGQCTADKYDLMVWWVMPSFTRAITK